MNLESILSRIYPIFLVLLTGLASHQILVATLSNLVKGMLRAYVDVVTRLCKNWVELDYKTGLTSDLIAVVHLKQH